MDNDQAQALPEMWAVVGLFGHQKVAGKLTTQNLGAACLLRIDTPAYERETSEYNYKTGAYVKGTLQIPEQTRFVGVGAIYDLTPCSEATVRAILKSIEPAPVQQYELNRIKLLKAPNSDTV